MSLVKIWRRVNVSTLLVLPVFDDMIGDTRTRLKPYLGFPFFLLAAEYGLINSYLLTPKDSSMEYLRVAFNDTVLTDLKLTDGKYHSLNERIIDSDYFVNVKPIGDKILYKLKIPEKHKEDIALIVQSKYSKVSKEYKRLLQVKYKHVPSWESRLGKYVVTENLAHGIVSKKRHLREEMMDVLELDVFSNKNEFHEPFNFEKETLTFK